MSFTDLETIADLFAEAQDRYEGGIHEDAIRSGGAGSIRQAMTSEREERLRVWAARRHLEAVLDSMRYRRTFEGTWRQREATRAARAWARERWGRYEAREVGGQCS